nr:hypothetical protein [Tanacetum cinerariifolium]
MEAGPSQDYILMPLWNDGSLFDSSLKDSDGANKDNDGPSTEIEIDNKERPNAENNNKDVNIVGPSINTASSNINTASPTVNTVRQSDDFFGTDNDMRSLDGVEVVIRNIYTTYHVPTTLNTRIHKDHSLDNVIGDIQSSVQTRRMTVTTNEQGFSSAIYEEKTHEDLHTCLFACFLSQEEPKRIFNALKDPAWVEANQEELLQFHLQKGCTQEEGINYDEVFVPVARIEAIRLFLAYASFMGFLVYQMDVKSAFFQDKYVDVILTKLKYEDVKPASTLMDKENTLLKDLDGNDVDVHLYRITFAGEAHDIWLSLILDKKMIKYELSNGLRHLKLADADGISTLPTTKIFKQLALMGKTRTRTGRIDIRIPQSNVPSSATDEAITKEINDGLGRATTTISSLEVEQGSGKDYAKTVKNQSKPSNIGHEIGSLHQNPNQRAFFYNNQANEAKCQKIESSRAILAIYPKSK